MSRTTIYRSSRSAQLRRSLVAIGWGILFALTAAATSRSEPRSPDNPAAVDLAVEQDGDTTLSGASSVPPVSDRADCLSGYLETALQSLILDYRKEVGIPLVVATVPALQSSTPGDYASERYPRQTVLLFEVDAAEVHFVGTSVPEYGQALVDERVQPVFEDGRPDAAAIRAVHGLMTVSDTPSRHLPAAGGSGEMNASQNAGEDGVPIVLYLFAVLLCAIPVLAAPHLFFKSRYSRWFGLLMLSGFTAIGGCVGAGLRPSIGLICWTVYIVGFNLARAAVLHTSWGASVQDSIEGGRWAWMGWFSQLGTAVGTVGLGSIAGGSSSGGSSGSGGFSGGGGSFGGGGASGSW